MEFLLQLLHLRAAFIPLALLASVTCASSKRPFYIIGHQINSIKEVKEFLDKGSNVLESDIQFYSNGSVKEAHHGLPCECNRNCMHKVDLAVHLKHIRDITDPNKPDSYYGKMLMQFFDMKLSASKNKIESGKDMARHVLDYLWTPDGSRKQEVRVLLYFNEVDHSDVVVGFIDEFKNRSKQDRLADVGFDSGFTDSLSTIRATLVKLGITKNVWLGDGNVNCFSALHPYDRLKAELSNRDSGDRFIDKVYEWTVDDEERMRKTLKLGVDGMITNVPEKLFKILREPDFEADFRLAGVDDDPFSYYNRENDSYSNSTVT